VTLAAVSGATTDDAADILEIVTGRSPITVANAGEVVAAGLAMGLTLRGLLDFRDAPSPPSLTTVASQYLNDGVYVVDLADPNHFIAFADGVVVCSGMSDHCALADYPRRNDRVRSVMAVAPVLSAPEETDRTRRFFERRLARKQQRLTEWYGERAHAAAFTESE
jgi:hypothetical protein